MIEIFHGLGPAFVLAASAAIVLIAALRPGVLSWCGAEAVLRLWWILPIAIAALAWPKERLMRASFAPAVANDTGGFFPPASAVAAVPADHWVAALFHIWLVGALATSASLALLQWRFTRQVRQGRGQLPPKRPPAVLGAIRPRLVLAPDFRDRYDGHERRLVLLHERVHMLRRDGLANLAMAVMLVVQWFNPLVHWAVRALRRDQESACDAIVIRRYPHSARAYAAALLKATQELALVPLASGLGSEHSLVTRIRLLRHHCSRRPRKGVATAVLVLGAACGGALAYGMKREEVRLAVAPVLESPATQDAVPAAAAPAAPPPIRQTASQSRPVRSIRQPSPAPAFATAASNPTLPAPALAASAPPAEPLREELLRFGPDTLPIAKVIGLSLRDDAVLVEMKASDARIGTPVAFPRVFTKLGEEFFMSMGTMSSNPSVPGVLLEFKGRVDKQTHPDGTVLLAYRIEATPRSRHYFVEKGNWPVRLLAASKPQEAPCPSAKPAQLTPLLVAAPQGNAIRNLVIASLPTRVHVEGRADTVREVTELLQALQGLADFGPPRLISLIRTDDGAQEFMLEVPLRCAA